MKKHLLNLAGCGLILFGWSVEGVKYEWTVLLTTNNNHLSYMCVHPRIRVLGTAC